MNTLRSANEVEGARGPALRWYREPWPWLLLAAPALAVGASVATAVVAFRGADSLVAVDYYRKGVTINEELARGAQARALGLRITAHWNRAESQLDLDLQGGSARERPAVLDVALIDPARAEFDHRLEAHQVSADHYRASVGPWAMRHWTVVAETASWRLSGVWNNDEPIELR